MRELVREKSSAFSSVFRFLLEAYPIFLLFRSWISPWVLQGRLLGGAPWTLSLRSEARRGFWTGRKWASCSGTWAWWSSVSTWGTPCSRSPNVSTALSRSAGKVATSIFIAGPLLKYLAEVQSINQIKSELLRVLSGWASRESPPHPLALL